MQIEVHIMFRLMLSVTFLVAVWGDEEVDMDCNVFFEEVGAGCCEMQYQKKPQLKDMEIMKECSQLSRKSCEQQTCMATKVGYGRPDGTIDKANIDVMMERDLTGLTPEVVTAIKDKCNNGDLSKYGLESDCELIKWNHCFLVQVIGHCPSWHNVGPCEGMQEAATKCLQHFP